MGGFDGLTVKNGAIVNFNDGINARGGSDNVSVSEVLVSGNNTGIWIEGDFAKIQSVTRLRKLRRCRRHWRHAVDQVRERLRERRLGLTSSRRFGVGQVGDRLRERQRRRLRHRRLRQDPICDRLRQRLHGIRIAGNAALLKANTTNGNGSPDGISDGSGSGICVYLPNSPTRRSAPTTPPSATTTQPSATPPTSAEHVGGGGRSAAPTTSPAGSHSG